MAEITAESLIQVLLDAGFINGYKLQKRQNKNECQQYPNHQVVSQLIFAVHKDMTSYARAIIAVDKGAIISDTTTK